MAERAHAQSREAGGATGEVTPDAIGWAWDDEETIFTNSVAAVEAMPDGVDRATIDDFLLRYVRGAGATLASAVIEEADRDVTAHPAADFM